VAWKRMLIIPLVLGRRTPPGPCEPVCKVGHALGRNDDRRGRLGILLADQTEETEQRRPEHEEMQQGLAQQTRHGVYQIGEV